jgi:hypothetical protein
MSENSGTLEAAVGELTKLLSPLLSLTPTVTPLFFAELGLVLNAAQASAIAPALTKTTTAVGKLINLNVELDASIEAGGSGLVIQKRIAALNQIAEVISGFEQLRTAVAGLGLPDGGPLIAELPKRLFDYLLTQYLERSPGANQSLELAGVLVRTDHNVGVFDPVKPFFTTNEFHLGRVGGWLSDPAGQLAELYDWGTAGFDGKKILAALDRAVAELGLPALYDPSLSPPLLDLLFVQLSPRIDLNPRGLELRLNQGLSKGAFELGSQRWTLTLGLDANVLADTSLTVRPGAITVQPPEAATLTGKVVATYSSVRKASDPFVLLSFLGAGSLTVEEIAASAELHFAPNGTAQLVLGADLKRSKVRIDTANADGFVGKILGGFQLESAFDAGVGYSMSDGLHFRGSSALEIHLASHFSLGPLAVDALTLSIGVKGGAFPIAVTADLRTSLGPLTATVRGIGFEVAVKLVSNNTGNLGPVDVQPRFRPPNGVGLAMDGGGFKGGGFLMFDEAKGEYVGGLELVFQGIVTVKAVGLLNTKFPDGHRGFSLVILISAEFPPIQLGFGFTLLGVGGLLGLNRTVLLDELQLGVRDGSLNSILFPTDVVANATRIIGDLKRVFPAQDGHFLIGPMAKLGWGTPTLISLSVGLILDIPSPMFALIGVLRLALPAEDVAILHLQVSFAASVDFECGQLQFDASLFDSRVMTFTLSGDMAVRIHWKENANFLLSVGGFHPAYTPPPMNIGEMARLGVVLFQGNPHVTAQAYFAVTSNSVQFGARVEAYYGIDLFNVYGFLGLDVLINFNPFHFIAEIEAGLGVRTGDTVLFAIQLQLLLEGPTPWHARGTGSFRIGFIIKVTIKVGFDVTVGDARETRLPPVDVLAEMVKALANLGNWKPRLPPSSNQHVTLRALPDPTTVLVLHPFGALEITQKLVPLHVAIQRFGARAPDVGSVFTLADVKLGAEDAGVANTREQFAPAQFFTMSDAEKLSRPSFAEYDAGIVIGGDLAPRTDFMRVRDVAYELIYLPEHHPVRLFFKLVVDLARWLVRGSAVAQSSVSFAQRSASPLAERVSLEPERYAVVSTTDLTLHAPNLVFDNATAADQAVQHLVRERPELAGAIQALPTNAASSTTTP